MVDIASSSNFGEVVYCLHGTLPHSLGAVGIAPKEPTVKGLG